MSQRHRLTDLKVRNARPSPTRREIPDAGQRGLYLVVQPSGRKGFCVRFRINGATRKLTLKSGVSLADARRLASDAMYLVQKGTDPRDIKKTEKAKAAAAAGNTLQHVCSRYFQREHPRLRTAKDREAALRRHVFPVLGGRQVDAIKRSDITALLDRVEDGAGPRAADLVLRYLSRIFNWYAIQSDTFVSPIVRGLSRYDAAANRRKRILSDDEIRALWKATAIDHPLASLLRFLLLTGCRRSEGAGLRWEEVTGDEWLLPAARHKDKRRDLWRPLSKTALGLVAKQPRIGNSPYVFTADGKKPLGFGSAARAFLKKCGAGAWRVHDIRRTARTLLSRAGIDADVSERALGHALPGIRATYDHHRYENELRLAFEKLAALVGRIVDPPAAVVTPMRQRKR